MRTALTHPKSSGFSDRAIAEHCGVSHEMVRQARAEMLSTVDNSNPSPRTGKDGKTYKNTGEKQARGGNASAAKRAEKKQAAEAAHRDRISPGARGVTGYDRRAVAKRPNSGLNRPANGQLRSK